MKRGQYLRTEIHKKISIKNLGDYTKKGKMVGEKSPTWKKIWSEESREKLRKANLGKKQSQETINKRREFLKGHIVSEETRKKISEGNKGKKRSKAYKERHSEYMKNLWRENKMESSKKNSFKRGHLPWNKEKKGYTFNRKKKILSENERQKIREYTKKALNKPEVREKMSKTAKKNARLGKNLSLFKEGHIGIKGEKSFLWKGGITPLSQKIRHSKEYDRWRKSVLKRDNYTCQFCGQIGGKLNVDHIKAFSKILLDNEINSVDKSLECFELWDIQNGRVLCIECHKKTDTYLGNYYRSGKVSLLRNLENTRW